MSDQLHLETLLIHGGQKPDPHTGAVMPSISVASTYAQPSPGKHAGYAYARGQNPTRYALERCIALLEGSTLTEEEDLTHGGFAFASGMASLVTLLDLLDAGDHIIATDDLYGGTRRLLTMVRERSQGLKVSYVDMSEPQTIVDAITDRTRMIWVETPTNPLLKIVDLSAVGAIGKEHGLLTVCDNTFASPVVQRPLQHGFDIVMHSATKYLAGHSDVIAGILVTGRRDLAERLRFLQNTLGGILGPFEAYLTLRGLKTLGLRMRRHCESGQAIAQGLSEHPKVKRVAYPCLPSHPNHDVAVRQMAIDGGSVGGGMVTMWLDGGLAESQRFLEALRVFTLAESLGGVESLIEHPAIMTHASVPESVRRDLGIDDNLIRLSVGIENLGDLRADLDRAFAVV